MVEAISSDPRSASLDSRQRALVDYAIKLTLHPATVTEDDLVPLRASGLTDAGLHDLAVVVAYFNFVNRTALGLGVVLEPEYE